jgi:hypothetical protein
VDSTGIPENCAGPVGYVKKRTIGHDTIPQCRFIMPEMGSRRRSAEKRPFRPEKFTAAAHRRAG